MDRNDEADKAADNADATLASAAASASEPEAKAEAEGPTTYQPGDKVVSDMGKGMEVVRAEGGLLLCNQGRGWHDILRAADLSTVTNNIKGGPAADEGFNQALIEYAGAPSPASQTKPPSPWNGAAPKEPTADDAAPATNALHGEQTPEGDPALAPATGYVLFVSAKPEVATYHIQVAGQKIDGVWDRKRQHLVFRVPNDLVERFKSHTHCKKRRVIEAQ